jgi:hypothetical protein
MKKKNKATWRDGGLVVKGDKVLTVDGRERKRRGRKSVEGREGGEEGEERELRLLLLNGGVQVAAYDGNGRGKTNDESGGGQWPRWREKNKKIHGGSKSGEEADFWTQFCLSSSHEIHPYL